MKRKSYKSAKLGAVIMGGMLIMSLPMTAMAEKSTKEQANVETIAAATTNSNEISEKGVEEASEDVITKVDESEEGETANASKLADFEEESKISETTESVNEEETKAEEKINTETNISKDTAEDTTAGTKETEAYETKVDKIDAKETTEESEATIKETTTTTVKSDAKLSEAIVGTWVIDERSELYFGDNGNGKLILPKSKYSFTYKLNNDELKLNFSSSKANDATYIAAVSDDILMLTGGKGALEGSLELTKK